MFATLVLASVIVANGGDLDARPVSVEEHREVRVDADGWVLAPDAKEYAFAWTWSDRCAPERVARDAEARCAPVRALEVRTGAAEGERTLDAIWGTRAMLAALPDSHLPRVKVDATGQAVLHAPEDEPVWVRLDGPEEVSEWRRADAGAAVIALEATEAVHVELKLRGADDEPVERARVVFLSPLCEALCEERVLYFDTTGSGEMSIVLPMSATFRAAMWSDSHAPVVTPVMRTKPAIEIVAPPGARVRARAVDADGNPLAAAMRIVYRLGTLRSPWSRAMTAAPDGALRVDGLPELVEWTISAPGRATVVKSATLSPARETNLGDVVLEETRTVRVTVVDEAEVPVESARVSVVDGAAERTDANGVATLEAVPRRHFPITVTAPGFRDAKVDVAGGTETAVIRLDRGTTVVATLVMPDGSTPGEVSVRIRNAGRKLTQRVTVDERFILGGLVAGPTQLRIEADGARPFETASLELAEGETADLGTIVFVAGAALRGTVVDPAGVYVSDARVRVFPPSGDFAALQQVLRDWRETRSREDGSFVADGLAEGAHRIWIEAEGFAPLVMTGVIVGENGADLGTLELSPGRRVEVICSPVRRCGTQASILLAGADFPMAAVSGPMESGRATIENVPAGDPLLRLGSGTQVVHERTIAIPAGERPLEIVVKLQLSTIRGTVTIAGRPARGGSLSWQRARSANDIPILMTQHTDHGGTVGRQWIAADGAVQIARIDAQGRFELADVEAGEYRVTFRDADAATRALSITVVDEQQTPVDLHYPGASLSGRVRTTEDAPVVARVEIVDGSGERHVVSSDPAGAFRLLGVNPGRFEAIATARGLTGRAESTVDDGRSAEVVITLEDAAPQIEVTVIDGATGRGAGGALVFAMRDGTLQVLSSDAEGRASVNAGSTPLLLAAHAAGRWGFATLSGQNVQNVVLAERTGSLEIRSRSPGAVAVVGPNGFPLERVLPFTGIGTYVAAGGSLRVGGLPPGRYVIRSGGGQTATAITAGETTSVVLD